MQSFADYLEERKRVKPTFLEFLEEKKEKKFTFVEHLEAKKKDEEWRSQFTSTLGVPTKRELRKAKKKPIGLPEVIDVPGQAQTGFVKGFTGRATEFLPGGMGETPPPKTQLAEIAGAGGEFGGFIMGLPIKGATWALGRIGKFATKAPLVRALIKKSPAFVQKIMKLAVQSPKLGTAFALSDVSKPEEAPERFVEGATVGAIFSVAGLTHVTRNKFFNQLFSQFGGRALMKVATDYDPLNPESYSRENFPMTFYNELLYSYFLKHGMDGRALLTGKLTTPQRKIRKAVDKAIFEANKEAEATGGKKIPTSTDIALKFVHYGKEEGLEVLDPKFHGTGLVGEEAKFAKDYPELFEKRIYAYEAEHKKERRLPSHLYVGEAEGKVLKYGDQAWKGIYEKASKAVEDKYGKDPDARQQMAIKLAKEEGYSVVTFGKKGMIFLTPQKAVNVSRALMDNIIKAHSETDGSTYNLLSKKNLAETKVDLWAVALFKERQVIRPGKEIPFDALQDYIIKNADLLVNPECNVGTWYKAKDNRTYLDVSYTTPNKLEALSLGKQYEQEAIYNLKTGEEVKIPLTPEEAMEHAGEPVSPEALSRQKVQSFVLYDARTKEIKPLIGVDAVDIHPKPHEAKFAINKKGTIDYVDYGEKIPESAKAGIKKQVLAKGVPKEPWEMTKKEFEKSTPIEVVPGDHSILLDRKAGASYFPKEKKIIARKRAVGTPAINHELGHGIYHHVQPGAWDIAFQRNKKAWNEFLETPTAKSHWVRYAERHNLGKNVPQSYDWIEASADLYMERQAGRLEGKPNLTRVMDELHPHQEIVRQALSEGKTVPPEVLAEYPDLFEKRIYAYEPEIPPGEPSKIRFIDTFSYDVKRQRLDIRPGERAKLPPDKNEIIFRRNPDTGEITFRDKGMGVRLDKEQMKIALESAGKQLTKWDEAPFGKIDNSLKLQLKDELVEMNSAIQDFPNFLRGMEIEHSRANVNDWIRVREVVDLMKNAPMEKRMDVYNIAIGLRENRKIENAEIAEIQAKENELWDKEWVRRLNSAKKTLRKGDEPISRILDVGRIRQIKYWDARFTMQDAELWTRIPLYDVFLETAEGKGFANRQTKLDYEPILKLGKVNPKDVERVEDYFYLKSATGEEISLSPRQREMADAYISVLSKKALLVRFFRTKTWIEGQEKGLTVDEFKYQKDLLPVLKDAWEAYKVGGDLALKEFLADKDFGTIEAGNYLPQKVLGGKISPDYDPEWKQSVDFMTRGMLEARKSAMDINLRTFHELMVKTPLHQRLHQYLRGINSLEYMQEPLAKWKKLYDVYGNLLEETGGWGRNKLYSFADGIKIMNYRMKGYPIKHGDLVQLQKWVQKWFFRAFPVKPHTWFRNYLQPIVLSPHKAIVFNPKWQIESLADVRVGKRFRNLPQNAQDYFMSNVIQFDPIRFEFFFLDQAPRGLATVPFLREYIRAAEAVGSIYARVDTRNRMVTFIPMYRAAEHYLKAFEAGEISWKGVEVKLGLNKLRPLERKHFRWLVSTKEYEKAKLYIAKWEADNTNFIYDRSEKSFMEMTPTGEGFTNLITWSKGVLTTYDNAVKKIHEGTYKGNFKNIKNWNWKKVAGGVEVILATCLVGRITNKAYEFMTNQHFRKYQDYEFPDMIMYEFGGVSVGIVKESTEILWNTIRVFTAGTARDRKAALLDLASFLDNVAIRQMIPFMNSALGILEAAFGYSYIQPIRHLLAEKAKKVDRTFLEAAMHAFFVKDPNKRADVYKEVRKKRHEFYNRALETKSSLMRNYWLGRAKTYDYYVEYLKRYQPK